MIGVFFKGKHVDSNIVSLQETFFVIFDETQFCVFVEVDC